VLYVVDHDGHSLGELLAGLTRRFGKDFTVAGEVSSVTAIASLEAMSAAEVPVALLLADLAHEDFLTRAHSLYPRAKRVLLIDRDYTSRSPALQAMTLGRADYHIVRPWADEETMLTAMSGYLTSWRREQQPAFEEFRIVAQPGDPNMLQLRDAMTRFSMPFGLYASDSDDLDSTQSSEDPGLDGDGFFG
jgi:thioredoxin reductase (NADPH)